MEKCTDEEEVRARIRLRSFRISGKAEVGKAENPSEATDEGKIRNAVTDPDGRSQGRK